MSWILELLIGALLSLLPPCTELGQSNCKTLASPHGYDTAFLAVDGGHLLLRGEFHAGPGIPDLPDFPAVVVVPTTDH